MKLSKVSLKDKKLFREFLSRQRHELSTYSFENIYIWKSLFDIRWAIIQDSLCVFFRDKCGCFLYLPPLGGANTPAAAREAFGIMDGFNANKEISRIENVEADEAVFYRRLGFSCSEKFPEYLYQRQKLAALRGDPYKSKRWGLNFFLKNNNCEYLGYSAKFRKICLDLYQTWQAQRQLDRVDAYSRQMMVDSFQALEVLLKDYRRLACRGSLVKVDGKVRGFTIGFALSAKIFCVLYEITDLSVKGLAQFIFQRFCREQSGFEYINAMDDSGLENLQRVKLSYRPLRVIPNFIVSRKAGQ